MRLKSPGNRSCAEQDLVAQAVHFASSSRVQVVATRRSNLQTSGAKKRTRGKLKRETHGDGVLRQSQ